MGDSRDLIQFVQRVDVDGEYAVFDCSADLFIGLGYTVEDYLIRSEPNRLGLEEFTAGIDFYVASRASDRIQNRHVSV